MAMNTVEFLKALEEIEVTKGISKEVVINALKEAMMKAYKKELGVNADDAEVIVNIDPEKGVLEMFHVMNIVEEIEDDFLEMSLEDAKVLEKEGKGRIVENKFYEQASLEDLRKATAMSVKSILKQKFAEEEKNILFEQFKDKIGTMITGKVEKADERGVNVNIGKASVYLPHNQLIGDERFNVGESIRLFVSGVESSTKGGAKIIVSRANEGFLQSLCSEEIREIYDGTIEIKAIARAAGERSKVAVYTNNPDVDPAGACIGQNGSRIQKIVSQLGNGNAKEKIDIIAYSDNPGLFIIEALKPARVAGVIVAEGSKNATGIVEDDSLSLAIGRKGVNVRLAVRLTGYNIDIKTKSDALAEGLEFVTTEELQLAEVEKKAQAAAAARLAKLAEENETVAVLPGLPEGYVAPQARVYEDEVDSEMDEAIESQLDKEEEYVSPVVNEVKEEVKEVEVEAKPVEEVKPVEVKAVKTTTTLEDLEKNLEEESKKKASKGARKNYSRKKKDEEEEEEGSVAPVVNDPSKYMSIYTEEELREMEAEENEDIEDTEDDVDYDDYDEYYDDDDR